MKVIKYRARVVQRVYTFCAVDAQMQNTKDTRPICACVYTVYKIYTRKNIFCTGMSSVM